MSQNQPMKLVRGLVPYSLKVCLVFEFDVAKPCTCILRLLHPPTVVEILIQPLLMSRLIVHRLEAT